MYHDLKYYSEKKKNSEDSTIYMFKFIFIFLNVIPAIYIFMSYTAN